MKSMVAPSQVQTLMDTLADRPGLVAVYLRGSMERGNARADSDMDVALLFRHDAAVDRVELLYRFGELEARLGRGVHLAVLSTASLVFAKEVVAFGRRVYCSDTHYADSFAMRVLAEYADFNRSREPAIAAYCGKGEE